jgi:hypothetical protein
MYVAYGIYRIYEKISASSRREGEQRLAVSKSR